ncbi:hypothetical protein [Solitalea lacus]|uniref:hypothetical protein n=1 Tax=Solitalea lacus TaxID=2911172 RepID=UPI001EDBD186|nr:hypothetical protein [Solitalea lacus]UKJ07667.1 hypothetical protein L2B55_00535 [Solitalea lacus]
MVEVFKTNIANKAQALQVSELLSQSFENYYVNIDLEDCDKVLRVECKIGNVDASKLIAFLKKLGFDAVVLPDEIEEYNANKDNHILT